MRNARAARLVVLATVAGILAPAARLDAQVTTATLFGIVRDTSGAGVPGANVIATHEGTGLARTSVTDVGGGVTRRALPAGGQTFGILHDGLKRSRGRGVGLGPGDRSFR